MRGESNKNAMLQQLAMCLQLAVCRYLLCCHWLLSRLDLLTSYYQQLHALLSVFSTICQLAVRRCWPCCHYWLLSVYSSTTDQFTDRLLSSLASVKLLCAATCRCYLLAAVFTTVLPLAPAAAPSPCAWSAGRAWLGIHHRASVAGGGGRVAGAWRARGGRAANRARAVVAASGNQRIVKQ